METIACEEHGNKKGTGREIMSEKRESIE